jgi:hypothetical protein
VTLRLGGDAQTDSERQISKCAESLIGSQIKLICALLEIAPLGKLLPAVSGPRRKLVRCADRRTTTMTLVGT